MLDESSDSINPPSHELLTLEVLCLFLIRFLPKDVADVYQICPCQSQGVKCIHLNLRQSLTWMMIHSCLNHIAVDAESAHLGKSLDPVMFFQSASVGINLGAWLLVDLLLSHNQGLK